MNEEFYLNSFVHYLKRLRAFAGGYVIVDEKLPRFVVPDLTDFKVIGIILFDSHLDLARMFLLACFEHEAS